MASPNKKKRFVLHLIAGGVVLALAGVGHAALKQRIDAVLAMTTEPGRPLETIPTQLGDWAGKDFPIADEILELSTFDDFWLNRIYSHSNEQQQASVFIGYVGRPRAHIGHRPDVCYVAQGWKQLEDEPITIGAEDKKIEAVLYTFSLPNQPNQRLRVLATYLVNGQFTNDADKFTGWNQRQVNLFGVRQPAYIARVQVSMGSAGNDEELPFLEDLSLRLSQALLDCAPNLEPTDG